MLIDFTIIKLIWSSTGDSVYPYQTKLGESTLNVRMNDFPEEVMYTLIVDEQAVTDFDDWPPSWKRLS